MLGLRRNPLSMYKSLLNSIYCILCRLGLRSSASGRNSSEVLNPSSSAGDSVEKHSSTIASGRKFAQVTETLPTTEAFQRHQPANMANGMINGAAINGNADGQRIHNGGTLSPIRL